MVTHTLSRMGRIVRAHVNEVLDRLEEPERMVRQMVRHMELDVDRLAGAVGAAVAGRLRLQRELEANRRRVADLQDRAGQALAAGDESLARELLHRRLHRETTAVDLESALDQSRATAQRWKQQLAAVRQDLAELRRRQSSLIAELRARRRAAWSPPPPDPEADMARLEGRLRHHRCRFERLRQRLEQEADAAAAAAEVHQDLGGDDGPLERRCAELDLRQRVDAELAALRAAGAPGGEPS